MYSFEVISPGMIPSAQEKIKEQANHTPLSA